MKLYNCLTKMIDHTLTVVIRGNSPEEAIKTAEACVEGGVRSLEITFTVPQADKVIQYFQGREDLVVGAGSVLDAETARIAIMSGAQFIVGPNYNREAAFLCNRYQVPYIPGCMTINEAMQALESGSSIIKLFPGQSFDPSHIKAVKGPLPYIEIMPTGGVDLGNVRHWLDAGALLVGVGGEITKPAKQGNYEEVTANAKDFVEIVQGGRV
ncbi:bifunctional 2-keto-4-hydroxyglutarate aldolase/2-keto-3-deoxy-6-phosphogluconate aldolase [Halobacillus rhizosphaerae]|uniref:bifunctional 2-keto-4-hydroxyglutarate aldolase/2-keto-3-deoxy-6-phosphogluconate aldolase n=1 Tax=Halobacillus rhizosphaerae TaxID=3064889 RepID=UPI00398A57DF